MKSKNEFAAKIITAVIVLVNAVFIVLVIMKIMNYSSFVSSFEKKNLSEVSTEQALASTEETESSAVSVASTDYSTETAEKEETEEASDIPEAVSEAEQAEEDDIGDELPDDDVDSGMKDPLSDKEKYMKLYENYVGEYWNDENQAGWDLIGVEIINLNADKSDVPEVLTLWNINDESKGDIVAQTIFGNESSKNGHKVTSSSVYGYNLEIYRGSDGSTLAYTVNESSTEYLITSNEAVIFSLTLDDDPDFSYSVKEDYVGRVPDVFERASSTPASWSPDDSQYYKVTYDEKKRIKEELAEGKEFVEHDYNKCYISYSESGSDKADDWHEVWDSAWNNYEEIWGK